MAVYKHIISVLLKATVLSGLVFLAACAKNAEPENEHISFKIANPDGWNEITRGAELTNTSIRTEGFGIFAYHTETSVWNPTQHSVPDFMNNTKVTYSGGAWSYTPLKYWPHNQSEKVSFFAYAPHVVGQSITGSTLAFQVAQEIDNQIDLSWSSNETINLNKNTSVVEFAFKHALARIGFTVKVDVDGASPIPATVEFRIKNVTAGFDLDPSDSQQEGFYTQGNLNLHNTADVPVWTDKSGYCSFSLAPRHFVGGDIEGFALTDENTAQAQKLNADNAYIMVIPQDFGTNGFNISVEYEVILTDKNGHEYQRYTQTGRGVVKTDLEAGKTYTINITTGISKSSVELISITKWENGGEVLISNIVPDIV